MKKSFVLSISFLALSLGALYARFEKPSYVSNLRYSKPSALFVSKPHQPLRGQIKLFKISSNTYKIIPEIQFLDNYENSDRKIYLNYHLPSGVTVISGELNPWVELGSSNMPELIIQNQNRLATEQDTVIILDIKLGSFSYSTAVALSESFKDQEISNENIPLTEPSQKSFQSKAVLENDFAPDTPKKNRFISSEIDVRQ